MNTIALDDLKEKPKLDFAGFGLRLGAYLIDVIPILIGLNLFFYLVVGINPFASIGEIEELNPQLVAESKKVRIVIRYLTFLIWIIYCAIAEAGSRGGTHGKRMCALKVVDEYGVQLTFKKSLQRNLSKILSYVVIGLGFFWVLFHKQKSAWHDMIAKTHVVKID